MLDMRAYIHLIGRRVGQGRLRDGSWQMLVDELCWSKDCGADRLKYLSPENRNRRSEILESVLFPGIKNKGRC